MKILSKITGYSTDSTTPLKSPNPLNYANPMARRRRFRAEGLLIQNRKTGASVLFPWDELEAAAAAADPNVKP